MKGEKYTILEKGKHKNEIVQYMFTAKTWKNSYYSQDLYMHFFPVQPYVGIEGFC